MRCHDAQCAVPLCDALLPMGMYLWRGVDGDRAIMPRGQGRAVCNVVTCDARLAGKIGRAEEEGVEGGGKPFGMGWSKCEAADGPSGGWGRPVGGSGGGPTWGGK